MTLDRDQLSEAETLARAALSVIDVIEQTDFIMWRGDARMSLAYVLRNAGRPEDHGGGGCRRVDLRVNQVPCRSHRAAPLVADGNT
jgi:hypothetical protein